LGLKTEKREQEMATEISEIKSTTRSHKLFERAQLHIPGGVNSPVRACKAVGSEPIFMHRADGPYMYDVDGNRYIDYVGSWGPMILGHRHPRVLNAMEDALQLGTSFGAPCKAEVEIAELICQMIPSIEMVRMVNSGTEACMSAVRLARAFTKKQMVLKFDGCYHGHADSFLVKAGSGLATLGIASSPGVPEELSKLTLSIAFNDIDALSKVFAEHGKELACVILEPVVGNAGLILPEDGFLEKIRELCTANGVILIFDEVMTGFRVAPGGAQAFYKIKPDLTCLGKVIGGGLPVGAYGGRKDLMELIAPQGTVYQAGTLSGNPLAMCAGIAQLKTLQQTHAHEDIVRNTDRLAEGLREIAKKGTVPMQVASVPGMLAVFFTKSKVKNFADAQTCDTEFFGKIWRSLVERGIYWPPSQFEAAFISSVHSKNDIDATISAFEDSIKQ
jgi:glutamate-1-semialdehyde 2,1-aminomutase